LGNSNIGLGYALTRPHPWTTRPVTFKTSLAAENKFLIQEKSGEKKIEKIMPEKKKLWIGLAAGEAPSKNFTINREAEERESVHPHKTASEEYIYDL